MNLTHTDRLWLATKCRELEDRLPDHRAQLAAHRQALARGFERDYAPAVAAIEQALATVHGDGFEPIRADTLSLESANEVLAILALFTALQENQRRAKNAGAASRVTREHVRFPGFSSASEGQQLAYARHVCGLTDSAFRGLDAVPDCRSDKPQLESYRAILKRRQAKDDDHAERVLAIVYPEDLAKVARFAP